MDIKNGLFRKKPQKKSIQQPLNRVLQELRQLQDRIILIEASHNATKKKLTEHMADNVGIIGLRDAVTYRHKTLRIFWVILMLLGMAGTTYYIYKNTIQYLENRTATKIRLDMQDSYKYPQLVVCPPWWINTEDAMSSGISMDGLKYSLSYAPRLFKRQIESKLLPDDLISTRNSFTKFYNEQHYTSLADYFIDMASNLSKSNSENDTLYMECTQCEDSVEKVLDEIGVCYNLYLKPATRNSSVVDLKFFNTYNGDGVFSNTLNAWQFDITSNLEDNMPSFYLPPFTFNYLKINIQRMIMLNSCIDHRTDPAYDKKICLQDCFRQADPDFKWAQMNPNQTANRLDEFIGHLLKEEGFRNASNKTNSQDMKELAYSNWIDQLKNSTGLFNDTAINETLKNLTETQISNEHTKHCYKLCQPECDKFMYDLTFQTSHVDENLVKENLSLIQLNIKHQAVGQGGVTTWEEVTTMSFSDLVSNVGGTLGLFLGCTLMTVVQLILSLVDYLVADKQKNQSGHV